MSSQAVALVSFLFVAHFLGDFTPLANARMQDAKRLGRPVGPIVLHALVHTVLVAAAVVGVARPGWVLVLAASAMEFWTHFVLDWVKGVMSARRPALGDPSQPAFWTAFGLDQLGHAFVLVGIAWLVLLQ